MSGFTWRVGTGDFGVAADWTPGSVPGIGDTATFGAGSGTVGGTGSVDQLNFSGASQSWNVTGQLTAASAINVGLASADGQASIGSGGVLTLAGGSATVANGSGVAGALTIGAGGKLVSTITPQTINYVLNVGGLGTQTNTSGTLTVQGAGALLDLGGNPGSVGLAGSGTLAIVNGGAAKFGTLDSAAIVALSVARANGSSGAVSVSGSGSTLDIAGAAYVGRGGTGSLTIDAGAALVQTLSAGANASASADGVGIGNGGPVGVAIASGGTGTFNLSGGSTASFAAALSFGGNGSTGIGLVSGAGSVLTLGSRLVLGFGVTAAGRGYLTVQTGGVVRMTGAADPGMPSLAVGASVNEYGSVTVKGANSLLDAGANAAGVATDASGGVGALTVSGGGTVRSGTGDSRVVAALAVGNAMGSRGTVTVTGAGSSYTAAGYVYVGRSGTSTLLVDQGGVFTGGRAATGDGLGANGSFAVAVGDGTPATDVNGVANTAVNFQGTGTATVSNGSTLHTLADLVVGNRGGTGAVVFDSGSTGTIDRTIQVGTGTDRAGGTGSVTVKGGSTVRAGGQHLVGTAGVTLGMQAGTSGSVTVTGAASVLDANGDRVTVGSLGTGSLTVAAGGKVLAGARYADAEAAFTVGSGSGAVGTVTITDAGSQIVAAGLAVLGGTNTGSGVTAGGTAALSVNGGLFRASGLAMFAGSTLGVGAAGDAVIGSSAGTVGSLTVDAGASITGAGTINATVNDAGAITAQGGTLSIAAVNPGAGTLGVNGGTLDVQGANATNSLVFGAGLGTIRLHAFAAAAVSGSATVAGFAPGDTLDFTSGAVSLSGNVVTVSSGGVAVARYTLQGLGAGMALELLGDGAGGTKLVGFSSPDPLFDPIYYLANNPAVAAAGIDPYQQFMTTGWKEGRTPSALFDTNYYLTHNPDVAAAGINPFTHFEAFGWKEGRDPSADFSVRAYLAAYRDVAAAGMNPLLHYVQNGRAEGRVAFAVPPPPARDPLVDTSYVYAHNPAVAAAGLDASAWYNSVGWTQGANPNAYFDTNYYLARNPDVRAAGVNPLAHFEASGWKEGRQPSLVFDDAKYLAAYTDVAAAGIDPLAHYVASGRTEGRLAFLTGGTAAADPLVDAAYFDAQLGATILPGGTAGAQQAAYAYDHGGWQAGLNPDALFNTAYYLSHNPDVAAAHIDPLLHYEAYGWKEGRDPSAAFSTNKYLAAYSDVARAGVDPLLHYVVSGHGEGRAAFAV